MSEKRAECFFRRWQFFKNRFIYLFGRAGSWLLCGLFSSCGEWGLLSSCGARASHRGGFSCCREWALGVWASVAVALGSGAQAQELWCMGLIDLPGSGIEHMSPALADRFFTTEPQFLTKKEMPSILTTEISWLRIAQTLFTAFMRRFSGWYCLFY